MLLSLKSFLLQRFRALLGRLSSSNLKLGDSKFSMDYNHNQSYKYGVFISFRGPDTRNSFVDHLYAHLTRKGIFAFKDDKSLEKGEFISPQLLQAIRNSRIFIVVFSKTYAESTWCLEEMAAIADCCEYFKQTVFPIFYDVDPSDVRKQSGVYQNDFVLHKKKFTRDPDKVVRWTKAMGRLAELVGWDVRNKPEFREIENIVQEVIKTLGHKFSGFADDLIATQPRVEELESLLKLSSDDDELRVVGIWGMAGIGKTTLASVLYDRISSQFDASCFIENVSKIYRDGGAVSLQKQILRQTIDEKYLETYSPSEISGIVRKRLCNRKFLVVLDNVDLLEQVEELAINPELVGKGSRMIITTRNMHILRVYGEQLSLSHGTCVSYEVPLLNNNDARELFYRKAFKSKDPASECLNLTPEVLKYVEGLPLAIRVVGSFLCTRNANQWRDALYRLRNNPDNKVMDALQVCFEGLHSEDREIFLHIACFFKGEKEEYVKRILDACGLHPHLGIQGLIESSLITIRNQEIHMHEMLQELGKKIVRQQFPEEPGSWSRLWLYEDFNPVMMTETGTDKVKAIILDKKEDISEYPLLKAEGLSIMRGLKILILYHTNFSGSLNFLSNSLQYLLWYGYPFASLPLNFEPLRLVELNMPCSLIKRLWDGHKNLPCLKRVDLSNSRCLVETPNFTGSQIIERLDFTGCINLSYVHPSIGLLKELAFLSLEGCRNLVSLVLDGHPASNLYSLKVLHLSGCSKLEIVSDFRGVSNLEYLDIDQCVSLSTINQSIGDLTQLKFLSFRECTSLASIPESINSMTSLETLDLCGCFKLESLPLLGNTSVSEINVDLSNDELISSYYMNSLIFLDLSFCNLSRVPNAIGELRHLERLNLEGNNLISLPSSVGGLSSLAYLNLAHCSRLQSLPELQLCATSSYGGRYFKMVSGSHNHRSGLYIFNCPHLKMTGQSLDLAVLWLKNLVKNPCHFRCGLDIVVPSDTIPLWFDHQFAGNSRVKITDYNKFDNWLGFAFCVAFVENCCPSTPASSQLPYPLYLSFESEQTEETFDIPIQLDLINVDGSNAEYIWLIYISRPHCHFVTTGAQITFKAHPGLELKTWGLHMVFEHDIYSSFELNTNEVHQNDYIQLDHVHECSSSKRPEVQLPYDWYEAEVKPKVRFCYNWYVTEEEENENREVNGKQSYLLVTGLPT
ncbi:putative TIR domain, winged helix-turn-helix DNA-binding domain-containing protein [Medicago truncatula]|nr:disease resistance protein RPV1 [Medicago truncatula]XP_024632325.1 disease resistance protein RPV1 [Medicago truncatula]KEH38848.1 disease resistance protein (TIR-NBS-LRR class), putative [Medicago truncatula]RHN75314.1 putative TIR domain, winged helix-turn-helix DNA-binding domain-containing protein [Medicago truncatula]